MQPYPVSVEYKDRQVWGAWYKVPVEMCVKCPLYMPFPGNRKNDYGQPGSCNAGKYEAKHFGLSGQALCDKAYAESVKGK